MTVLDLDGCYEPGFLAHIAHYMPNLVELRVKTTSYEVRIDEPIKPLQTLSCLEKLTLDGTTTRAWNDMGAWIGKLKSLTISSGVECEGMFDDYDILDVTGFDGVGRLGILAGSFGNASFLDLRAKEIVIEDEMYICMDDYSQVAMDATRDVLLSATFPNKGNTLVFFVTDEARYAEVQDRVLGPFCDRKDIVTVLSTQDNVLDFEYGMPGRPSVISFIIYVD